MIPQIKSTPTGKVVSAYYTVHPDDRETLVDAVLSRLATTAQQDGCIYYVFAEDLTGPNAIDLTENWRDQAALDVHFTGETFRAAVRAVFDGVRILDYQSEMYEIAAHTSGATPNSPAS